MIRKDPSIKIGISAYLTTEIREQITERIRSYISAEKVQTVTADADIIQGKNVYIFLPYTIYGRDNESNLRLDLLVVDEAHVGLDEECLMLRTIERKFCKKDTKILLVTATPWDLLAKAKYKEIQVYKRSLQDGISDGLVSDFDFCAEEAQVSFKADDFSRVGDLKETVVKQEMAVLKSSCLGKMKNIISRYDKEMGNKVLVICPKGNYGEIARWIAQQFGGLAFLGRYTHKKLVTKGNLEIFKMEPKIRFLCVVGKCQVPF